MGCMVQCSSAQAVWKPSFSVARSVFSGCFCFRAAFKVKLGGSAIIMEHEILGISVSRVQCDNARRGGDRNTLYGGLPLDAVHDMRGVSGGVPAWPAPQRRWARRAVHPVQHPRFILGSVLDLPGGVANCRAAPLTVHSTTRPKLPCSGAAHSKHRVY